MPIPQELRKKLEKYPSTIAILEPVYDKPSLPTGYEPKQIDIYCDQMHAVQWRNNKVTHMAYREASYVPEIIEWVIDDELVCIILDSESEVIFSRLDNKINMPEELVAQPRKR